MLKKRGVVHFRGDSRSFRQDAPGARKQLRLSTSFPLQNIASFLIIHAQTFTIIVYGSKME